MSYDNLMQQKHYAILGANTMRYVTAIMEKPTPLSNIELGKAIEMMVQLIQREAERDSRETFNQQQGERHGNTHK
jgi:hypothetical protein